MDEQTSKAIQDKLLSEKERLTEQLGQLTQEKTFNKEKTQVKWGDMGDKDEDNAVEVANYQDSISLEHDLEKNLDKINNALKKIETNKFGKCENCGQEIEVDRLMAYPEAELCLKCMKKINQ